MRLAPSSNSPTGSQTPGCPLTTTPKTETTTHSSMPTSALPSQAETQSPEDIPTLPTSSNSSTLPPQHSSSSPSSLITTLQPYSPSLPIKERIPITFTLSSDESYNAPFSSSELNAPLQSCRNS
ncbi:uncharacterized protein [Penaeus vannamei]|uniref:uncharacterized protein n=1 Tax=Penaeus vannamei TaxID=6689 RepID=UPI00387FA920